MRIELRQEGDEICGDIYLPADPAFVLEGLAMVVEQLSKQSGVSPDAVVRDLYSIVTGNIRAGRP